ncbi:hypothetical protein PHYSODRAFT_406647, partial [Phytophthora sojae]
ISNYAELAMWAGARECTTRDQFFGHSEVYDAAHDLAEFKARPADFRYELIVLKCFTYGDNDEAMGIHRGGWTLVDLGTYAVHHARGAFQHKFIPWAYMFVRSE